jgi:hypothetical protein
MIPDDPPLAAIRLGSLDELPQEMTMLTTVAIANAMTIRALWILSKVHLFHRLSDA